MNSLLLLRGYTARQGFLGGWAGGLCVESVGWADLNILNSCDCHPGKVRVGSRGGRSYCFQGSFGYSGLSFSFFTTKFSFLHTAGDENFVLVGGPLHDCRGSERALCDAFEVAKVT